MTLHIKGVQKLNRKASINGEVFFPGTYILSDGETIKDLIKRAGGLKENAFVKGAFFQREDIRKLEKEKISSAKDLANKEILYQQSQVGGAADLKAGGTIKLNDKSSVKITQAQAIKVLKNLMNLKPAQRGSVTKAMQKNKKGFNKFLKILNR